MGFKSIDQPADHQELNVIQNEHFIFWLERGGKWGSSASTSVANHQKLNVIQKQAFHVYSWRGVVDGVWVHWPVQLIIRSWTYSKNEHFIFLAGEGWQMGFESINQPSWSSEVERNPKMSIHFLAGEPHLPPLSSHKNEMLILDYIQLWCSAGLVDGFEPHLPPLSSQKN